MFHVIMTSFLFFKVISEGSNSDQRETTLCKGKQYAAPDCDTSDSDLVWYIDETT